MPRRARLSSAMLNRRVTPVQAGRLRKNNRGLSPISPKAQSIEDKISMSGTGVNGKTLVAFKSQCIEKIDGAGLTKKSVNIAKKLA